MAEEPAEEKKEKQPAAAPALAGDIAGDISLLKDIPLEVRIELGRCRMYLVDVLKLKVGSMVELEKLAGDPVDVVVNEKLVARGEILVLNDNFCVRVTDVLNPEERTRR